MIKVGIIGCGVIADQHVRQIQRIPNCEIVGVCDRQELMAKQLYERLEVKQYFNEAQVLLEITRPDVVHITTPPQTHFELGRLCLENGCHVYMEKPFTLNTKEAETLINLAQAKKLKITVGHNVQFSHETIRMRQLINDGFLGGQPVHLESYYSWGQDDDRFSKDFLSDKSHWVRKLPGQFFHDIISHGISKIVEFLSGDNPQVIAHAYSSPFLKFHGENGMFDELRVIINDNDRLSAYLTLSSQISPRIHQFRVYGPKNSIFVDNVHKTLITLNNDSYKSYLNYFIPPRKFAKQYLANSWNNIKLFIKKDFHTDSGLKYLIESFYQSIRSNSFLPISYREILLTAKIIDDIFSQIYSSKFK